MSIFADDNQIVNIMTKQRNATDATEAQHPKYINPATDFGFKKILLQEDS